MDSEHEIDGGPVPHDAWVAADRAFNEIEWSHDDGDELHRALAAASPHIRAHELADAVQTLTLKVADVPLLGRRNNGVREGLELAIQLLTERRGALEEAPHGRSEDRGIHG